MKLGEALSERARLQRQIGELRTRINTNVTVQEDTDAAEDANALLGRAEQVHDELAELVARINATNAATMLGEVTLTAQLAARDRLAGLIATYKGAADAAGGDDLAFTRFRSMRSELKTVRTVEVAELRRTVDHLAVALRKLDNEIQAINWTTDLI